MDYQQLLMLLALLNGKAGGQITGADLSRIEDPILGILTGNYNAAENDGPNLADLSTQYRPTWESLLNEEYYDESSVEMQIASSIAAGTPLMEVRKQIPQFLANSGLPAGPNDTTTQEFLAFATKLDGENRDYNVALTKANTDRNQNSWWAKAGISDPSLKADPAQILNPQLERLAQMYKPLPDSNKTGGYMGSGGKFIEGIKVPDAAQQSRDRMREKIDAEQESEIRNRNPFFQMINVAKDTFLKTLPQKSKMDEKRDMERMIVRRDAMGGRPSTSKVPIRTNLLNKQREDSALRVAAILKEKADRQAASMPTPAETDIMNRIVSLAMAERLKR